jgi:predicted short-subunit dehydrogenase-like oxidoreductase (DUF2520 family)
MPLDIVILGSGNLASALSLRLWQKGSKILQVYSRNSSHAELLASKLKCDAVNSLENINTKADLYLICIKDDVISEISKKLSKFLKSDSIIAHTSGVNSIDIIHNHFLNRGLFYPLQSFSREKAPDWSSVPIFIEGSKDVIHLLNPLAKSIGDEVIIMNDKIRTHLHLASVIANNFTNYNLIIAKKILDNAKVPFGVLRSLMKETIDKAFIMNPRDAQTGPAKRGDSKSIEKHIRLLVQEYPEYRSLYKKYSQIILQDFKHENNRTNTPPQPLD